MKIAKLQKTVGLFCAAVMILSVLSACAVTPAVQDPDSAEEPVLWAEQISAEKTEIVSQTMNADPFDERLFEFLSRNAEGNYMASPLSFRYALGLLLAGAEGETKAELLNALGVKSEEEWTAYCLDFNGFVEFFAADLEKDIAHFREGVKQGWMPADAAEPFRALRVANSVWKAERIPESFKDAYRESVERNYAAEYRSFTPENAVSRLWGFYQSDVVNYRKGQD